MSVTYASGFRAAGIMAGLKPSARPDLGLLLGEPGTTAAGVFTTNRVAAAPVRLSRAALSAGRGGRGVVVNSGQANAATGERGDRDARTIVESAAAAAGADPSQLLACSTGVIGEPVHLDRLIAAIPDLVQALSADGGGAFAQAIMTTDTVDKQAVTDAGPFRVGGCAKGVGMIAPHLATMLVFVTTDAAVEATTLQWLAAEELAPRFNALTVDACPSTNDTVLLFASGAAEAPPVLEGSPAWDALASAIGAVGDALVGELAADAEGATHVILVDVSGAGSEEDARVVARAVAESPLVKTAAFGGDPNPGRILQAVGSSGVPVDPASLAVSIGGVRVATDGTIPPGYFGDEGIAQAARVAMKEPEIHIEISLGDAEGRSRAVGCDLSYEYVRINGEYTT